MVKFLILIIVIILIIIAAYPKSIGTQGGSPAEIVHPCFGHIFTKEKMHLNQPYKEYFCLGIPYDTNTRGL